MIDGDSLFSDDDLFVFADEKENQESNSPTVTPWKVLIVDDEEEIHNITELVLREIVFDNAPLTTLSAYSSSEALEILKRENDIAIVLLDVVMEKDTSGLDTVKAIRNNLNNHTTRIVLRTGQPGKAPERSVILDYDINDYREKTELTAQKLFTTVVAALRNYRDMNLLKKSHTGMEQVIDSSAIVFSNQHLHPFAQNIIDQAPHFIGESTPSQTMFVATRGNHHWEIMASNNGITEIPNSASTLIDTAQSMKDHLFTENKIVGYFKSKSGTENILYADSVAPRTELDIDLIKLFFNNIEIAYENIYLNIEMIDTQKDIILRMGDVVETRSKETAFHVYRVAEFSYMLAKKIGLSEEDAQVLRHASPMHDVGKVGVPDGVLLKPGTLTTEEFDIMKTHTTMGYNIFCQSPREIVRAAATIAHEHHERWDGKGYPRGLQGDDIHIFGRITAITDVFDALSSKRAYKRAWSTEDVFQFIVDNRGKHFDPVLVDAFMEIREDILKIKEKYPDKVKQEEPTPEEEMMII